MVGDTGRLPLGIWQPCVHRPGVQSGRQVGKTATNVALHSDAQRAREHRAGTSPGLRAGKHFSQENTFPPGSRWVEEGEGRELGKYNCIRVKQE